MHLSELPGGAPARGLPHTDSSAAGLPRAHPAPSGQPG